VDLQRVALAIFRRIATTASHDVVGALLDFFFEPPPSHGGFLISGART